MRDIDELNEAEIAIRAIALQPRRAKKQGEGDRDVRVQFSGVTIEPGAHIYADADGIIVSSEALSIRPD